MNLTSRSDLAFGAILRWTGATNQGMEVMVLSQVGVAGFHVVMLATEAWYWHRRGEVFFLACGRLLFATPLARSTSDNWELVT